MVSRVIREKTLLPTIQEATAYDTVHRKRFACFRPGRTWGSVCNVDTEEGAYGCEHERERWSVPENDSSRALVDQNSSSPRDESELRSFHSMHGLWSDWAKWRKHKGAAAGDLGISSELVYIFVFILVCLMGSQELHLLNKNSMF